MPKSESRELQEAVGLVRDVEATLAIKHPSTNDERFRTALLARTTVELPKMDAAFVRRCYAAACAVEYASDDVVAFRYLCQKRLAVVHGFPRPTAPEPTPRTKAA